MRTRLRGAHAPLLLVFTLISLPFAEAAQRTFVATTGNDASASCALSTPCRTFGKAISVTDPNGEIVVLDSGGYGGVTINKSVAIVSPAGIFAGVSVFAASDGITIVAPASKVSLRGLTINGQGGNNGIRVQAGEVHIEHMIVSNLAQAGISVEGGSAVEVLDTVIRDNADGVRVRPGAGANVQVIVRTSEISGNSVAGVAASPSASGVAKVTAERTNSSRNGTGFLADTSGGGSAFLVVTQSVASDNAGSGVSGNGVNSNVFVRDTAITRNATGLSQASSASVTACGNNLLVANTSATSGAITFGACLDVADGTVSNVATGAGLTGGPITTTGTISVAASGIQTSMLADGSVTSAKLGSGAVDPSNLATTGCSAGDSLVFDGTAWGCTKTPVPRPTLKAADHAVNAGQFSSLVIGIDGFPLVAFYDQSSHTLKALHCDDVECSTGAVNTVDAAGDVGQWVSLTLNSSGFGVMSYYDATNQALKVADCADLVCSTATAFTVDSTNDVGMYSSIATDRFFAVIAYYDNTLKDVKIAMCNSGGSCASSSVATMVSTGNIGEWTALAIGPSGQFLVAYYDATNRQVRLARCSNVTSDCPTPTIVTVETLAAGHVGEGLAITVSPSGAPVLSYADRLPAGSGIVKVAVCDDVNCAAPTITFAGQTVGASIPPSLTSVAIGADGLAVIAMSAASLNTACNTNTGGGTSKVGKCRAADCSVVTTSSTGLSLFLSPSVAIGVDGNPVLSAFHCGGPPHLETIHCGNANCAGSGRPR